MKLPTIRSFAFIVLSLCFPGVFAGLPDSVDGEPLPTLAPMLERTTPSVVNISTTGKVVVRDPFF